MGAVRAGVRLGAVAALAALWAQAQEAGEKAGGGDPWLAWKWVNFVILAGALGYLISKSAGSFFRSRTAAIREGIDEAARMKREAEERAAAIERKVSGLEKEVERLRGEAKAEFAAEGERIERETAETLRRIQQQAEGEIESLSKAARLELKAYAAGLAVDLAEGQIRAAMDGTRDAALIAAFAGRLGRDGAGGDGAR